MHSHFISRALTALLLSGVGVEALAHVEYYDLNQGKQVADLTAAGKVASTAQYGANGVPAGSLINGVSNRPLNDVALWTAQFQSTTSVGQFSNVLYSDALSTATVRVNDVTDRGWGDGTRAVLGDSHKVGFFNFRLAQTSQVTLSWNVFDNDGNFFDGGFSLYSGVLSYQAHDDASADPLNPKSGFPPRRVQNLLDTGLVTDAQNITAEFRNTRTNTVDYAGQFDANGNWGQANGAGNWSNIAFLAAVNTNNPAAGFAFDAGSTLEALVIELGPGNYTIAASGALGAVGFGSVAAPFGLSGLNGELKFHAAAVSAVPLPAPLALLGFACTGLAAFTRRRRAR